jgi:hypothetical protein
MKPQVVQTTVALDNADLVRDVDSKKMSDQEALLWKVCVLCEAYMRGVEKPK